MKFSADVTDDGYVKWCMWWWRLWRGKGYCFVILYLYVKQEWTSGSHYKANDMCSRKYIYTIRMSEFDSSCQRNHIFALGGRRGKMYTTWLLNASRSPDSSRICKFTSYRPLETLFEWERVITHCVSGLGFFLNSTDKQSVDRAWRV